MKALSLFAALFAAALPVAAASDGYLGWESVTFEDGAGWRVHVSQSEDPIAKGLTRIKALEISRHGQVVEIPSSATSEIHDPVLNNVKLLTMCCSNKVKLQIPVFPTGDLRKVCKTRVWEISIIDGKYAGTAPVEVNDESGLCD